MNDPTKLKTTEDGADIYVTTGGQFFAVVGNCQCRTDKGPVLTHSRYCRAKTISRKSLSDLERELTKVLAIPIEVKAIQVDRWGAPREARVVGAETDRTGYRRYRSASGDLLSLGVDMREYSDEAWIKLTAAHERVEAATRELEEIKNNEELLPKLTRERIRELQARAREETTNPVADPEMVAALEPPADG
jgi:hypothetical protein